MPVGIKSSGGGTTTLVAANSATNYTATLPANSGTIITTGSTGKVIPSAALPAGCVLQVLQTVTTATQTTSSSTFSDISGLSVSITPSSSTNKVLVSYTINCSHNINTGIYVSIIRNSTSITTNWAYYGQPTNFTYSGFPITISFLDSPATTSATTYKLQWRSEVNGNASFLNRSENGLQTGFTSTITAMEIAA